MIKALRVSIAATLVSLLMSASANAMLIYSNGFNEESDIDDWFNTSNEPGGVAISGPAFSLSPQEGAGYLAFTGNENDIATPWYGGLFLDITSLLIPGLEYQLSYYWGGRGAVSSTAPILEVGVTTDDFGSGNVFEDQFFTNGQIGVWTQQVVNFIAPDPTDGSTFLDLAEISTNSENVGPAIDNLTITRISPVPAPGTLALLALGLLSVGLRQRKS